MGPTLSPRDGWPGPVSNAVFLGPPRVFTPKQNIDLFSQFCTVKPSWAAWQTDWLTDTAVSNNSLHLIHSMQPDSIHTSMEVLVLDVLFLKNSKHYRFLLWKVNIWTFSAVNGYILWCQLVFVLNSCYVHDHVIVCSPFIITTLAKETKRLVLFHSEHSHSLLLQILMQFVFDGISWQSIQFLW